MSVDDLRARQRQSVIRSKAVQIGLEILRTTEMKTENVQRLQALHGKTWHQSIAVLPDGWTDIVGNFLGFMDDLGDLNDAVSLRFERSADGLRAFAFPEMEKWTAEQMDVLRTAQGHLLHASRETCEWCGKGQAEPVHLSDRESFFMCQEHKEAAEAKLAAQVRAYDERVRLRDEMTSLFMPMSVMSIQVSDRNFPILQKALRDIKKIVEERELIGKVYVTKVEESEGQLFINARCDQADPASQFEIQDIVHHAQWQSDQASLAANKEGHANDA